MKRTNIVRIVIFLFVLKRMLFVLMKGQRVKYRTNDYLCNNF